MSEPTIVENNVETLRQLLLEMYVSSAVWPSDHIPEAEAARMLDTVLAAAQGEPFQPLGLPFPRDEAAGSGAEAT